MSGYDASDNYVPEWLEADDVDAEDFEDWLLYSRGDEEEAARDRRGEGEPDSEGDSEEHDFEDRALTALRALTGSATAHFRPGQIKAIKSVAARRERVLVVQRTGWGKSAVYFVATKLLREDGAGATIIVSPLLALMRNQIAAGRAAGLRIETINSTNNDDWPDIQERIANDDVDALIISPERFANQQFLDEVLPNLAPRAGLFVVDEVHCISDWGHDFRPDYRRIGRLLDLLPRNVPVLGTTATANDRVVRDIEAQFGTEMTTIRGPLDRESLRLDAIDMPSRAHRMAWLAEVIPTLPGTGIVYCLTVHDAHRLAGWLRREGIAAESYAADLGLEERLELEERLLRNDLKVLCATSALGMGYDKPDLGFVFHYQSPGSPIAYYQQVGRAGRAIPDAVGVLLSGAEDKDIQDWFMKTAFPSEEHAGLVLDLLEERSAWMSVGAIEEQVNLRRTRITHMLKVLEVEGVVERSGAKYRRTLQRWTYPTERIEQVAEARRMEQAGMQRYLDSEDCLMLVLREMLDDPTAAPCGRCSRCAGRVWEIEPARESVARARSFLRGDHLTFEPRKQRPSGGRIKESERVEIGHALGVWADGGWGSEVRDGKSTGHYPDALADALVGLVRDVGLDPAPEWVTAVPSTRAPALVADLALRVAQRLGLPFAPVVVKVGASEPQKTRENSAQQYGNVASAFEVQGEVPSGPVLLIDDVVDSRWTITVVGNLLRVAGSGPVHPVVLAQATPNE